MVKINVKYPKPEWLRVYTDGSKTNGNNNIGAGIYSKLFSHYLASGTNSSTFYGEIKAIEVALRKPCLQLH